MRLPLRLWQGAVRAMGFAAGVTESARLGAGRQAERKRFRRLMVEQFEDRRVLATAVDDLYVINVDETLTVEGYGTWSNDTYNNQPWGNGYSCTEYEYIPGGYDENEEWQEGYFNYENCIGEWLPNSPGYAEGGYSEAVHGDVTPLATGIPHYYDENNNPVGQYGFAFSYVPPLGFFGDDTFTYSITDDGQPTTSTATVTIRVSQYAPTAADDSYSTDEDTPLTIEAAGVGVLNNDSDDNPITANVVSNPANGTLSLNPDGTFTYTPYSNFNGTDSFVYEATDGRNGTPATVTITVDPIADAPLAYNDGYAIDTSLAAALVLNAAAGVLANDYEFDNQPLAAILDDEPEHGEVTLEEDGSLVYTPDRGFSGNDSFTYYAHDGDDDSNVAIVQIAVSQSRNIDIGTLTSHEDTDLKVSYTISGGTSIGFSIGLYASADGETPDQLLQTVGAVDLAVGTHELVISPEYDDLAEDYYLVAVVDHWDEVGETNETDNVALFACGTFLLHEPTSDELVRMLFGCNSATAISVTSPDEDTVQISARDPSSTASVPNDGTYLDFNGDGVVSQLDLDVLARNLASADRSWQNPVNRFDVDGDTYVSASDLLALINRYNAAGYHDLPTPRAPGQKYLDVSGDGYFNQNDLDHWNSCRNGGTCTQATWQNPDNMLDVNDDGEADVEDLIQINGYLDEELAAPAAPPDDPAEVTELRIHGGAANNHLASYIAPSSAISVVLLAGLGNDVIYGSEGDDHLVGGPGNDTIYGRGGDDTVDGGEGDDTVDGGDGDDSLSGGDDADALIAGDGDDSLSGDDGNDKLKGDDGEDEMHGGDGDDSMDGGQGNDWLWGDDGDDHLDGQSGNDDLYGGLGQDVLSDSSGTNSLSTNGEYVPALVGYTSEAPLYLEGQTAQIRFAHLPGSGMHAVTLTVVVLDGDAHAEEMNLAPARAGIDTAGGTTFTVHIPAGAESVSDPISIELKRDDEIEPIEYYWIHILEVHGGGHAPPPFDWASHAIYDGSIKAYDDVAILDAEDDVIVNVLTNDYAALAQPLRISSFMQPTHGEVSPVCFDEENEIDPDCNSGVTVALRYEPNLEYPYEEDSFKYTIEDDHGHHSDADVFLSAVAHRRVVNLTSDKGAKFWEGDTVTFTAALSGATPGTNEIFVWERRSLSLITRTGQSIYSNWESLPGAQNSPTAQFTFSDPFIGQVRVTLTSSGKVSHKAVDVRAQAAYPTNFHWVRNEINNTTHRMNSVYEWESITGRWWDLDGVSVGEFVYATQDGYNRVHNGLPAKKWLLPKPPFNTYIDDGEYNLVPGTNLQSVDTQGGVIITQPLAKAAPPIKQILLYQIHDGFHYNKETDGEPMVQGDPSGDVTLMNGQFIFSVVSDGNGGWIFRIENAIAGTANFTITGFPWQ